MDNQLVEVIVAIIFLSAMVSGMKKGAFRDIIQFIIWVPLFIYASYTLIHGVDISSQSINVDAQETLKTVGFVFFGSYIVVWILDKIVIRTMLEHLFGKRGNKINSYLGLLTGFTRTLIAFAGSYALYGYYTQEANNRPEFIENSTSLSILANIGDEAREYAIDKEWIEYQKIIYDEPTLEDLQLDMLKDLF